MKGIILAGGSGTRLSPLTKAVNKHLLPVYDKPMIYYPLTTLILAGVRDVLVIVTPGDLITYKQLLGNGSQFGISIDYAIQEKPSGIPQGISIAHDFLNKDHFILILGDNIFYGVGLGRSIQKLATKINEEEFEAVIFTYKVPDPERYGVILETDDEIKIIEKPNNKLSDQAITGLYIFNNNAINNAANLKPSKRGELEITDLIEIYSRKKKLFINKLNLGTAWLDTGTFSTLNDASNFIKIVQERQHIKIGDPVGASTIQGWL